MASATTLRQKQTSRLRPQHRRLLTAVALVALGAVVASSVFAVVHAVRVRDSRNNEGMSFNSNPTAGNFDGEGNSYSQTALNAIGFVPQRTIAVQHATFTWPNVADGAQDNWQSSGQAVPLPASRAGALTLLGAATNGQASGKATVSFTDGSTQVVPLTLSDWTLGAGSEKLAPGEIVAATLPYRNSSSGQQPVKTYIFFTAIPLDAAKTTLKLTLPTQVTGGQLHIFQVGTVPVTAPGATDWSQYLGTNAATSYNAAQSALNANTVADLKLKWETYDHFGVTDQPIVVNGNIYWGDWRGFLHDSDLSGNDVWKLNVGVTSEFANCQTVPTGIGSSPNYQVINGVPTILIGGGGNAAAGDGSDFLYAINAATGAVIWHTLIGNVAAGDFAWSSALFYNGSVYYGMGSYGDCPLSRGRLYKLDAATGVITATVYTTPSSCVGATMWGTPSIDASTGMLYIGTGNSNCIGQPGDYNDSMLEINAATMTVAGSWEVPPAQQAVNDSDFGSAPTLFSAVIDGEDTAMVGIANKGGWYYAFKRNSIGAGPVWEDRIANGGDSPDLGDGSISPSAWDSSALYMAGGITTINGQSCNGSLRSVNPATGTYIWQVCLTNPYGWVDGAVMEIPGVVFVNSGNTIQAFASTTGAHLFTYNGPDTTMLGPLTVADNRLYDGDTSGNFFCLGL